MGCCLSCPEPGRRLGSSSSARDGHWPPVPGLLLDHVCFCLCEVGRCVCVGGGQIGTPLSKILGTACVEVSGGGVCLFIE